jgi:hypothetical protein
MLVSGQIEIGETGEHAHHFDKQFVLAGQTVNSAYCCDVLLRMCKDFAPKFGEKRTGFCITAMQQLILPLSVADCCSKTT